MAFDVIGSFTRTLNVAVFVTLPFVTSAVNVTVVSLSGAVTVPSAAIISG